MTYFHLICKSKDKKSSKRIKEQRTDPALGNLLNAPTNDRANQHEGKEGQDNSLSDPLNFSVKDGQDNSTRFGTSNLVFWSVDMILVSCKHVWFFLQQSIMSP